MELLFIWKMFQRALMGILKDTEETQEELVQHRHCRSQTKVEDANRQAQKRFEQKRVQMDEHEDDYARFLVDYTQTVLEHKEAITDGINNKHREIRQWLKQVEQSPYSPLCP